MRITEVPPVTAPTPAQSRPPVLGRNLVVDLGWVLSLFLVGAGAKLWLIFRQGSPLPFLDQWPAGAINLFIPYFQKHLTLATLFQAHNEHRIVPTRLLELGLFLLNRQWDDRLECVVNGFIHPAIIAGFGWQMAGAIGRRNWPLLWLPLVLALVLPFAWENTIHGFQSQFYFMILASLLTFWYLGQSPPFSSRWRFGAYAAIASLFIMASGFLAAVAVGAVLLLDSFKQRGDWWRNLPTWILGAAVTIAALLLKPDVAMHHQFQAHSTGDFLNALGKCLAWPWAIYPWYAFFNLFPLLLLGRMYFRSLDDPLPVERIVLIIGVWVGLQSLAAAYARGGGGSAPAWRYMDLLSFIMIANCLSILLLVSRYHHRLPFPRFCYAGFALWAVGCLSGLWFLTSRAMDKYLPEQVFDETMQLQTTRAFLATGDEASLEREPLQNWIVHNVDAVEWLLRHPIVRGILPACAREPLRVAPVQNGTNAFILNGCSLAKPDPSWDRCWGSYSATGPAGRGTFESLPVKPSALPFLEIPVAGDLGEPGLSLELVELATGRTVAVQPSYRAKRQWLNVYVKAPAGQFKIVARDSNETKWFAFKEPREMGRLSYWALQIATGWKYFVAAGIICLLLTLILARITPDAPKRARPNGSNSRITGETSGLSAG